MTTGKFISYLRVSTQQQGKSGLGLEAQREAVAAYLNGGRWKLVEEVVEIEAGAFAQFGLVDFAPPPLFEDVLIAGEDGFDSEDDRAIPGESALLDQRCGVALGAGQGVVVADQDHVGGVQGIVKLLGIENRIVVAKRLAELANIFAAA